MSVYPATLAAGTQVIVQVDSFNAQTSYGAVLETHERAGGAYNNIGATAAPTSGVQLPISQATVRDVPDNRLPDRAPAR